MHTNAASCLAARIVDAVVGAQARLRRVNAAARRALVEEQASNAMSVSNAPAPGRVARVNGARFAVVAICRGDHALAS